MDLPLEGHIKILSKHIRGSIYHIISDSLG